VSTGKLVAIATTMAITIGALVVFKKWVEPRIG